jgi:hypothetical protein
MARCGEVVVSEHAAMSTVAPASSKSFFTKGSPKRLGLAGV